MDEVEQVHEAARLALVRHSGGQTRWIPYSSLHNAPLDTTISSLSMQLQPKTIPSRRGGGHLDLDVSYFPHAPHFRLLQPHKSAPVAQNVLIFLHGRGDSHEPFARLGKQMELPQTAVISLRAPQELPFGLGFTWMNDLDSIGDVILPVTSHKQRSQSLEMARDYIWNFLCRSTLPRDVRLGGMVLVSGGAIAGPHLSSSSSQGGAAATPMLQVTGAADDVYPAALAEQSRREFKRRYSQEAAIKLFTSLVRPGKGHAMIDSREDMQQVMSFFSKHLYLRNIALENRSDVIELQT